MSEFNFDKFYKAFEDRYRGDSQTIYNRQKFYIPILEEYRKIDPSFRLVDIGCGRCEFLRIASNFSENIVGVDISEEFSKYCSSLGFKVYNEDAIRWLKNQQTGSYDLITAFQFVEHLEFNQLVEFLNQAYRVLNDRGSIILEFPYIHSYKVISHFFWLDPTHKRPLDPYFLGFLLEYLGFKAVYSYRLSSQDTNFDTLNNIIQNSAFDCVVIGIKEIDNASSLNSLCESLQTKSQPDFFALFDSYDKNITDRFTKLSKRDDELTKRVDELNHLILSLSKRDDELTKRVDELNHRLMLIENSKLMRVYRFFVELKNKILKKKHSITVYKEKVDRLSKIKSDRISKRKNISDSGLRKKLAYLSPLPPQKSGISFYSKNLLEYLSKYYDITIVTDSNIEIGKFEKISYIDLYKNYAQFQRILVHMGNNPLHKDMLKVIEELDTVVVLHDFYLPHLFYSSGEEYFLYQLYYSHGYKGLYDYIQNGLQYILDNYPVNRYILNLSIGTLVHSDFAKTLCNEFYCKCQDKNIKKINFPVNTDIDLVRDKKDTDQFNIISYGFVNSYKAIVDIIQAFGNSELLKQNANFIVVGEVLDKEYGEEIKRYIQEYNLEDRVVITGYLPEGDVKEIFKKADVAIQLRKVTRGENSQAVFELMKYGIPVIVNNLGSFTELPDDAVLKIKHDFNWKDILEALETVYHNRNLLDNLSKNSKAYIYKNHNLEKVAKDYHEYIEEFYNSRDYVTFDDITQSTIYIDISTLINFDHKTGIQRVMKAQLKNLIIDPPKCYRVEPVYLEADSNGKLHYRYARKFMREFMNLDCKMEDEAVVFKKDDILYIPDYNPPQITAGFNQGLYQNIKANQTKIVSLVYDLLPIKFPQFFPVDIEKSHIKFINTLSEISDKIITISESVKKDLIDYLRKHGRNIPYIDYLHLGADFKVAVQIEPQQSEENYIKLLQKKKYFLMVSTLEPRKGFDIVLDAFDILWSNNFDYQLVFVGKQGWKVDNLIHKIKNHKLLDKKLFWFGHVSDYFLEYLYKNAVATIVASKDEGFGLAIVESALYKTPVIARDIPVFREIAKEGAFYFPDTDEPKILAEYIQHWIQLEQKPNPELIKVISWKEHTDLLKEKIIS